METQTQNTEQPQPTDVFEDLKGIYKDTISRAYGQGIDHAIGLISQKFSGNEEVKSIVTSIVTDLKKLAKHEQANA